MSGKLKAASLTAAEIRIDFAVLPETICQGLFNHFLAKTIILLILLNFLPYHSFNFFAHSFGGTLAEMHLDYVGCLADFLFYCRSSVFCFCFSHSKTSVSFPVRFRLSQGKDDRIG